MAFGQLVPKWSPTIKSNIFYPLLEAWCFAPVRHQVTRIDNSFVLVGLIPYVPVNNFSVMSGRVFLC